MEAEKKETSEKKVEEKYQEGDPKGIHYASNLEQKKAFGALVASMPKGKEQDGILAVAKNTNQHVYLRAHALKALQVNTPGGRELALEVLRENSDIAFRLAAATLLLGTTSKADRKEVLTFLQKTLRSYRPQDLTGGRYLLFDEDGDNAKRPPGLYLAFAEALGLYDDSQGNSEEILDVLLGALLDSPDSARRVRSSSAYSLTRSSKGVSLLLDIAGSVKKSMSHRKRALVALRLFHPSEHRLPEVDASIVATCRALLSDPKLRETAAGTLASVGADWIEMMKIVLKRSDNSPDENLDPSVSVYNQVFVPNTAQGAEILSGAIRHRDVAISTYAAEQLALITPGNDVALDYVVKLLPDESLPKILRKRMLLELLDNNLGLRKQATQDQWQIIQKFVYLIREENEKKK